jgi:hypothetical protein
MASDANKRSQFVADPIIIFDDRMGSSSGSDVALAGFCVLGKGVEKRCVCEIVHVGRSAVPAVSPRDIATCGRVQTKCIERFPGGVYALAVVNAGFAEVLR